MFIAFFDAESRLAYLTLALKLSSKLLLAFSTSPIILAQLNVASFLFSITILPLTITCQHQLLLQHKPDK